MKIFIFYLLLIVSLTACSLTDEVGNAESILPENSADNAMISGWFDALEVMSGICFESAFDAVGQTFIVRNEQELFTFFNLADNSRLCRWPVERQSFDFSQGTVLAGLWSYGIGCTAGHDVVSVDRDDSERRIRFTLEFYTEGDCPYELIRPFWIGIRGAQDYDIILDVTPRVEQSDSD